MVRAERKEFRDLLLETVDEALLILGESARKAIYWHLERQYSLKRGEIADRLSDFVSALNSIFGRGSAVIQGLIVRRLYSKLGLEPPEEGDFLSLIRRAREVFESQST